VAERQGMARRETIKGRKKARPQTSVKACPRPTGTHPCAVYAFGSASEITRMHLAGFAAGWAREGFGGGAGGDGGAAASAWGGGCSAPTSSIAASACDSAPRWGSGARRRRRRNNGWTGYAGCFAEARGASKRSRAGDSLRMRCGTDALQRMGRGDAQSRRRWTSSTWLCQSGRAGRQPPSCCLRGRIRAVVSPSPHRRQPQRQERTSRP
jgi:hypothetical protein